MLAMVVAGVVAGACEAAWRPLALGWAWQLRLGGFSVDAGLDHRSIFFAVGSEPNAVALHVVVTH